MSVRRLPLIILCAALVSAGIALNWHAPGRGTTAPRIDFNRDIRPILNQNCTSCHGGVKQQAGVSFIYREEALGKGKSGRPTVIPGRPNASELIARVTSMDPETRMPYHAPPLQPKQIALLKEWIREGAPWEEYWAFVPPKPQPLPTVKRANWVRQPMDRFILARLEKENLSPSPEADKAALLRRVSFDLTGLPPTPQELSAFLADAAPNAYEKQVERLLASPHYGERWAAMWLDLARYADSKGYERDFNRPMWPYRDWVINAFNRNLPYDQFVVTQIAGDLLPNATLKDRIATAFHRQTPANDEGGVDDEEYRLLAVMDRAATTWSVLNGVTMNCVQCHSHPYDPLRHAEYYKFLAFFNTTRDADVQYDDSPVVHVPTVATDWSEVEQLEQRKAQLLREIVARGRAFAQQSAWSPLPIASGVIDARPALERHLEELEQGQRTGKNPFAFPAPKQAWPAYYQTQISATKDLLAQAQQTQPTALNISNGQSRAAGTIPKVSAFELFTGAVPPTVTALRLEVLPGDLQKALHTPELGFIVDRVRAWIVPPAGPEQPIEFKQFVTDSEANVADSVDSRPQGFAANAKLFTTRWLIAVPNTPLLLEAGARIKLELIHSRALEESKPAVPRNLRLSTSGDERWTALANDEVLHAERDELAKLSHRLEDIPHLPLPIMVEQPEYERRQTLEFERGNFLNKVGPTLSADVPALFPKFPRNAPRDRLTMARWFFAPGQPLTARVAVNRYWEQLFGTGIVETLEDFGSSGQLPTHPELLDWLALHFQNDLHWDMKALLRELVTSATYRQSARVTPGLLKKDPRNQLLAHGPQQRLTAEMVRDQALLASDLLTPAIGGPSVMPPQPAGVWMTVYNGSNWTDATGPDRYRRAIYTFIKRTAVYPSFVTFDAADHLVSVARRIPTNTPLQALVTLNDPVYYEAATALARQMRTAVSSTGQDALDGWLNAGARRVLSRDLLPQELATLKSFYADARKIASSAAKPANPARASQDQDRIALIATAGVLLNLDAALTR